MKTIRKTPRVGRRKKEFRNKFVHITSAPVWFVGKKQSKRWWFFNEGDIVQIMPITDNNTCIVNKQWRPGVQTAVYEFPVGYIEKNESPRSAAQRELLEETGLLAKKLEHITTLFISPSNQPTRVFIFIAEQLQQTKHKEQSKIDEQIKNKEIPITTLFNRLGTRGFNCVSSSAAALYLKLWMEQKR